MVNPNDHVNCNCEYLQTMLFLLPENDFLRLLENLKKKSKRTFMKHFVEKAKEFDHVIRNGTAGIQDAVPIRLGQEFQAYSVAIMRDIHRIKKQWTNAYVFTEHWWNSYRNRN